MVDVPWACSAWGLGGGRGLDMGQGGGGPWRKGWDGLSARPAWRWAEVPRRYHHTWERLGCALRVWEGVGMGGEGGAATSEPPGLLG